MHQKAVKNQANWLLCLPIFPMMGSSVVAVRTSEMVLNFGARSTRGGVGYLFSYSFRKSQTFTWLDTTRVTAWTPSSIGKFLSLCFLST